MDKKKIAGVIATAAAVAFVTAPLTSTMTQAAHHHHKIKCYGVNSCKGKSACKTAKSSCKGKNSCKGQGYLMKSEKHCKKLHGSTEEPTS